METPSGLVMATAPVLPLSASALSAAPQYFRLPDESSVAWTRDASKLVYPNYRDLNAWNAFREACVSLAAKYLPTETKSALRDFFAPDGQPAIVLENLPVDPHLPSIPSSGVRPTDKESISEAVIVGIL